MTVVLMLDGLSWLLCKLLRVVGRGMVAVLVLLVGDLLWSGVMVDALLLLVLLVRPSLLLGPAWPPATLLLNRFTSLLLVWRVSLSSGLPLLLSLRGLVLVLLLACVCCLLKLLGLTD